MRLQSAVCLGRPASSTSRNRIGLNRALQLCCLLMYALTDCIVIPLSSHRCALLVCIENVLSTQDDAVKSHANVVLHCAAATARM